MAKPISLHQQDINIRREKLELAKEIEKRKVQSTRGYLAQTGVAAGGISKFTIFMPIIIGILILFLILGPGLMAIQNILNNTLTLVLSIVIIILLIYFRKK